MISASRTPTWRPLLALSACALLLLWFAPAQYFGRQEDDVLYFVGAKALTEGRYCLLTAPGCPPLTIINPGWPLLLAPLVALFGSPAAAQALAALILAAVPFALWAWLRKRVGEWTAVLAAGTFAASPLVFSRSGVAMSEPAYTLALIAALAAAESGRDGWAGALGSLLLLLRTAGAAAIPALAAPALRSMRPRRILLAAAPALTAYAAWATWSLTKLGAVDKVELLRDSYAGRGGMQAVALVLSNARFYVGAWGGSILPPSLAYGRLAVEFGILLCAAAAAGVWKAARRRSDDPALWALLGAVGLHAFWGWQYERYLLPLLPLLLWAVAEGAGAVVLAGMLFLELTFQVAPRLPHPSPFGEPELAKTYVWLAQQPKPKLLASVHPYRDGWLSGLPGIPVPQAGNAASLAQTLKKNRADFILFQDDVDIGLEGDPSSPWRRRVADTKGFLMDNAAFRLVHEEKSEKAVIYAPR